MFHGVLSLDSSHIVQTIVVAVLLCSHGWGGIGQTISSVNHCECALLLDEAQGTHQCCRKVKCTVNTWEWCNSALSVGFMQLGDDPV